MTTTKNPKTFHYEFGGPIGTGINILLLPVIVILLGYWSHIGACMDDAYHWIPLYSSSSSSSSSSLLVQPPIGLTNVIHGLGLIVAWILFQIALERCLPATIVTGTPIPYRVPRPIESPSPSQPPLDSPPAATTTTTTTLQYRINGHLALWVTLFLLLHGWPTWTTTIITTTGTTSTILQFGTCPYWSYLYHHFIELAVAMSIFCYVGSVYLYWYSFRTTTTAASSNNNNNDQIPVILADGGNSGNMIYDFFMGRELNPRPVSHRWMSHWDLKEFCELRPGLMAWLCFNLSCAHEQYQVLGYNTGSMILIQIFHFIYVWDALYQEAAILSTMDITTDGFGFMLLFGDLCWVPFTYSLQARYLVHHDPHLNMMQLCVIVIIHLIGYTIFRNANSQKDQFRRNPNAPSVAHLSYIETKRGTKLLTSGYWGMARKINYTGDYIMGVSWCLVCGFDSIVPYFYAIYFLILLIHRSERDDHLCHEKYGDDWIKYKEIVPYRFIPGII